jgi:hypothetical protein
MNKKLYKPILFVALLLIYLAMVVNEMKPPAKDTSYFHTSNAIIFNR